MTFERRRDTMWDKARKILYRGGEILELLMAAAVVAGILVAMITLVPELARYWNTGR